MILRQFLILFLVVPLFAQQWQSSLVYYDGQEKLQYTKDEEGNRIPDFSYAGYKNGMEEIPQVEVVKTISPVAGDNTSHINNALFEVSLMSKDANGIKGALLLEAGLYEIQGTIKLNYDGVILRGVGQESDTSSNTVLYATGNSPSGRNVIMAGGGSDTKWREQVSGTKKNIITDTVFVGERTFEVEDASVFNVGDNIVIYHPCTDAWLAAIDYGGTHSDDDGAEEGVDVPWEVNSEPIVFNRYITAISGNFITIDAPVFNHLNRSLSQAYVYTYRRDGLRTNIGVENLRIDIEYASETDENHAKNALAMYQIEDAWVKDCIFLHFSLSGIITNTATRITVDKCSALDPKSIIEGGKRYNFQVYTSSQQILFQDCLATNGRHHYVSNGHSFVSGVVFLDCQSSGAYTSSEGHRRWSQGLLYDNLVELDGPRPDLNPRLLGLYNRGYAGTSHGWAAVHSVAWNCDMANGDLICQKPPTAQNYAIGCSGANITGIKPPAYFDEQEGFIEGSNTADLYPRSLYLAQLQERKNEVISIEESSEIEKLPQGIELFQNYPNPFNPSTTIKYALNRKSDIKIEVFDLNGKLIKTLATGSQNKGVYKVNWNGKNQAGDAVSSGMYVCTITNEMGLQSRKMLLLK